MTEINFIDQSIYGGQGPKRKPWGFLVLVAIIIIWVSSCSSARDLANKAYNKDAAVVAELTRQWFPCITTKSKTDSSGYFQLLKDVDSIKSQLDIERGKEPITLRDTLTIADTTDCVKKCNDKITGWREISNLQEKAINDLRNKIKSQKPIHDTTFIEDSAKIKVMARDLDAVNTLSKEQAATIKSLDKKLSSKNKQLWIHRSLWILLLIYFCYRTARKFKII